MCAQVRFDLFVFHSLLFLIIFRDFPNLHTNRIMNPDIPISQFQQLSTFFNLNFIFPFFVSLLKWSEVAQSCPTLCYPMDYSLPGSSVHGIFPGRILEWGAISPSGYLPDKVLNSGLLGLLYCRQILYHWATWESNCPLYMCIKC